MQLPSALCVFCTLAAVAGVGGVIAPNELPTLLSIVYSNIPPVKIGLDSRVGFGFRLGPHSDFQTLVELGPQQNTKPLPPDTSSRRRSAEADTDNEVASNRRAGKIQPVQLKKVPGIDTTVKPLKPQRSSFSTEAAPTKFVIL